MSSTGPEKPLTTPEAPSPISATAPAPVAAIFPPLPGPDLLTRSTTPFRAVDFALKGYHLDATVTAEQVVSVATELDREGFALDTITGVDWLAEAKMEVVYDYFHPLTGLRVVVRSRIPREDPQIPTISEVFPGANWHERETHDFFGIRFLGHPNLEPFLLPEDATYHPLRKDFTT
jgi:NADH-quinone oxidoreductase subunit C